MSGSKLVVFDLGRVLIRICDDMVHAAEVAGLGGKIAAGDAATHAVLQELVVLNEIGAIDNDLFCQRVARLFNVDPMHIARISDAYLLGPFDGIGDLIDELRARELKTACLSNTNPNHWRLMCAECGDNALPLQKLDYRFASHLARLRKPEAAIYKHVEAETGFAADQIVFFDDNAENVEAARIHGWDSVLITDRTDPVRQMRAALVERSIL